jgi:hypothetical protein
MCDFPEAFELLSSQKLVTQEKKDDQGCAQEEIPLQVLRIYG